MTMSKRLQSGFAAMAAVFILVVLAALGAFMVTFSNTQQLTSAQDVQGTRAYWAARAGLEWAIFSISANTALCPNATMTQVGSAPASLSGFTIQIWCARTVYVEAGGNVPVTRIESRASLGNSTTDAGKTGYIERSVSASMER